VIEGAVDVVVDDVVVVCERQAARHCVRSVAASLRQSANVSQFRSAWWRQMATTLSR